MRTMFALLLATVLFTPAFADEGCCPTAGPEHEKLWFFIGEWTGEETWTATESSPMSGKGLCTWNATRTMNGMFVELEYATKFEQGAFEGKSVLGYDARTKTYRMWWFDASGTCNEPSIGSWNGSALVFEGTGECSGNAYKARYTYEIKGHNEFTFSMAIATGDSAEYVQMMTSTIHRIGGRLTTASAPKAPASAAAAATVELEAPGCCKEKDGEMAKAEAEAPAEKKAGCCKEGATEQK